MDCDWLRIADLFLCLLFRFDFCVDLFVCVSLICVWCFVGFCLWF